MCVCVKERGGNHELRPLCSSRCSSSKSLPLSADEDVFIVAYLSRRQKAERKRRGVTFTTTRAELITRTCFTANTQLQLVLTSKRPRSGFFFTLCSKLKDEHPLNYRPAPWGMSTLNDSTSSHNSVLVITKVLTVVSLGHNTLLFMWILLKIGNIYFHIKNLKI